MNQSRACQQAVEAGQSLNLPDRSVTVVALIYPNFSVLIVEKPAKKLIAQKKDTRVSPHVFLVLRSGKSRKPNAGYFVSPVTA